jgi:hypothetical protein
MGVVVKGKWAGRALAGVSPAFLSRRRICVLLLTFGIQVLAVPSQNFLSGEHRFPSPAGSRVTKSQVATTFHLQLLYGHRWEHAGWLGYWRVRAGGGGGKTRPCRWQVTMMPSLLLRWKAMLLMGNTR